MKLEIKGPGEFPLDALTICMLKVRAVMNTFDGILENNQLLSNCQKTFENSLRSLNMLPDNWFIIGSCNDDEMKLELGIHDDKTPGIL